MYKENTRYKITLNMHKNINYKFFFRYRKINSDFILFEILDIELDKT